MKKNNKIKIKEIATLMNKDQSTVYRWFTGVRSMTAEDAKRLEFITGLKAESFIFPERYGNRFFRKARAYKKAA